MEALLPSRMYNNQQVHSFHWSKSQLKASIITELLVIRMCLGQVYGRGRVHAMRMGVCMVCAWRAHHYGGDKT